MTEPTQKVQKPSNSKTLKLKTKIYSLLQQSHCQSTPDSSTCNYFAAAPGCSLRFHSQT